jgi:hypothetical protein
MISEKVIKRELGRSRREQSRQDSAYLVGYIMAMEYTLNSKDPEAARLFLSSRLSPETKNGIQDAIDFCSTQRKRGRVPVALNKVVLNPLIVDSEIADNLIRLAEKKKGTKYGSLPAIRRYAYERLLNNKNLD